MSDSPDDPPPPPLCVYLAAAGRTIAEYLDAAGYVIVPKEPTEAMVDAAEKAARGMLWSTTKHWRALTATVMKAMIEARPR